MIEGRLNISLKGRLYFFRKKQSLHVQRNALYFVGVLFLERSHTLSGRKIAVYE